MARDKRLTGLHPLSYMGVRPTTPAQLKEARIDPKTSFNKFPIGTQWINTLTDNIWILTNVVADIATWTQMTGGELTNVTDAGNATAVGDEIDIIGSGPLSTAGAGNTVTLGFTAGTDGQLIIADTGGIPAWANLTSTGGSVTITNTANGINLEAAGVAAVTSFDTDAGTATPIAGVIEILGGLNLDTSAATNVITIDMINDPVFPSLGAGFIESSAGGVLSNSEGTNGQLIIGATGAPGAWANLTSAGGTITITEGANTLNVESLSGLGAPYLYVRMDRGPTGTATGLTEDGTYFIWSAGQDVSTSTTGVYSTWTVRGTSTNPTYALADVHAAASGHVVAISSQKIGGIQTSHIHSATAIGAYTNYSLTASPATFTSVWNDGTYWVITGNENGLADGIWHATNPAGTWTFNSNGVPADQVNDCVFGGGTWVIVGDSGNIAYQATDPTGAWTAVAPAASGFDQTFVGTPVEIEAVAYSATLGLFCAVGSFGRIATSPDGITWTQRTNPGLIASLNAFNSIHWDDNENMFIARLNQFYAYSYDGIVWRKNDAFSSGSVGSSETATLGSVSLAQGTGNYFLSR